MIGRRHRKQPPPPSVLDILLLSEEYRTRLDHALSAISEITNCPDCYLYVAEPGGRRLHLGHTKARPAADPSRFAPGPMEQTMEGGAEWSVPTPPFEIMLTEADNNPRVISSPVGNLYSFPLCDHQNKLFGLLQAGPVANNEVPAEICTHYEAIAGPLAIVVSQTRRQEELRQRLASATAQVEANQRLASSAVNVEQLVSLLLDLALSSTQMEAGFVAIQDPAMGELVVQAATNMPEGFAESVDLSPKTGLLDWSAVEGGALFLRDVKTAKGMGIRSILAVPLIEGSESLGVFALVNYSEGATFDENSLDLLEAFATQIRLMLHNSRLFSNFAERYLDTIKGLAHALDARRPETNGHHDRVSDVATTIAKAAGLGEEEVTAVATAGLIHDVGLAGSSEGSWETDVEHPTIGASLIAHLPLHPGITGAVAAHHEWFDGWGFPNSRSGNEIPPTARVLAIAEFLIEMTTPDVVRPGWTIEHLTSELTQRRGSQFDPFVVDAAIGLLNEGVLELPVPAQTII